VQNARGQQLCVQGIPPAAEACANSGASSRW
jgi:hypothetical protein